MTISADSNPYKRDSEAISTYEVNKNNRPFFVLDAISSDLSLSLFSSEILAELNYWTLQEKSLVKALEEPSPYHPEMRYNFLLNVFYGSRAQSAVISIELKRLEGQIDPGQLSKEMQIIRDTTLRAILIETKKAFPNSASMYRGKIINLDDTMVQHHRL